MEDKFQRGKIGAPGWNRTALEFPINSNIYNFCFQKVPTKVPTFIFF